MGSSKKHKKNKSERRDKYEEYSQHQNPAQLQRGLKLILKVATPEYSSNSHMTSIAVDGPPTAAEAMMSPVPDELQETAAGHRERHKKSKKKKKKKDREKKHKHHKEKRHKSRDKHRDVDSVDEEIAALDDDAACSGFGSQQSAAVVAPPIDADSSQDGFSFMDDDQSQPLPENILFYAGITTDNSPSNCPVSKPIAPRKLDEILMAASSPASSSLPSSSLGLAAGGSPTKPLPDLHIPSPSTPGGASSQNTLTPKALEAPRTPSSSSESGREPRSCVLKLKQQKSPLNKLLEHLLRFLEKRDPHQFFAWPVTDDIAPNYSSIISKPMDFSTMRQKIDGHEYGTLTEFSDDFKLMCENAIKYNHVDTVYNKAAKKLLQVGMKHLQPENMMRSLKPLSGYMRELTAKELGFELCSTELSYDMHDSADEGASTGAEEPPTPAQLEQEERKRALRLENAPKTHFEPYVDDLTGEEILAQVQNAAQKAKQRVNAKKNAHKMGFLRQARDGSTTLNLLIREENEGPERVVTIGDLVGKLQTGSTQLQVRQLDSRNVVKPVKPLSYGAYASFAPTFDSRFSTLSAEETKLVLRTYGDASSAEYAESILQFTKDSSFGTNIANGLLDILTNGEHSKSLDELYNMQLHSYEHQEIEKCFDTEQTSPSQSQPLETQEQIEQEYEKYKNTRVDFKRLQSLKELGIDVSFLDSMETEMKNFELNRRMHEHLSNNLTLIEKLRVTQHERLSQPLPSHLGLVQPAGQEEAQTAHQLTQQITDLAKKLPPSAIADPFALRKAMGMSYAGLPPPPSASPRVQLPELLQQPVALPQLPPVPMDIDEPDEPSGGVGGDLENELREFLESGSGLHSANAADDNSIVAQLLLN